MEAVERHQRQADALQAAATGSSGVTPAALREAVLTRASGGVPVEAPHDALALQVRDAAYRVTDAQVAEVRAAAGTDKGAFEVIMAASIGAGLARWDAAARSIREASDAPD